jgi:L-aspartate oxidase
MVDVMHAGSTILEHLWIDARRVGSVQLAHEFPTFVSSCHERGLDPERDVIPIAPGAHYVCGGVRADLDGRTSVTGLYAVGEVADTGVHGANRLASNSLTEALVAGRRVGRLLGQGAVAVPDRSERFLGASGLGLDARSRPAWAAAMSEGAGVRRTAEGLSGVWELLEAAPSSDGRLDLATIEATNLHTVSTLVVTAALAREESRGCHRRADYPETQPDWAHRLEWRLVNGSLVGGVGALV